MGGSCGVLKFSMAGFPLANTDFHVEYTWCCHSERQVLQPYVVMIHNFVALLLLLVLVGWEMAQPVTALFLYCEFIGELDSSAILRQEVHQLLFTVNGRRIDSVVEAAFAFAEWFEYH
jgi:hypothetical protein